MLKFFKSLLSETTPVHYCHLCNKAYKSHHALDMAESCVNKHVEDLQNPFPQEHLNSLFKDNLSKATRYVHKNTGQLTALPISYCLAVCYDGDMIAYKNDFDEVNLLAKGDFLVTFDKNISDAYPIKSNVFFDNYSICV